MKADFRPLLQPAPQSGPEALSQLPGLYPAKLHYSGEAGQVRPARPGSRRSGRRGSFAHPQAMGHSGQPAEVREKYIIRNSGTAGINPEKYYFYIVFFRAGFKR